MFPSATNIVNVFLSHLKHLDERKTKLYDIEDDDDDDGDDDSSCGYNKTKSRSVGKKLSNGFSSNRILHTSSSSSSSRGISYQFNSSEKDLHKYYVI